MGMNNWGGSMEHMTKKPRRFCGTKRINRDYLKPDASRKTDFSKEEKIKRTKVLKEILIYGIILLLIISWVY